MNEILPVEETVSGRSTSKNSVIVDFFSLVICMEDILTLLFKSC